MPRPFRPWPSALRTSSPEPSARAAEDTITVTLDDGQLIPVRRVRHPRARRIKLSVDERGARLTLPPRASLVAGERFAHEHRQWLAVQLQRHAVDEQPRLQRDVTDALPLRGALVPVRWRSGRFTRVLHEPGMPEDGIADEGIADEGIADQRLPNDGIPNHGMLPSGMLWIETTSHAGEPALARALRDFYEAQARADIGRWLPAYLPSLPRAPARVQLKRTSSQWGSLSPDGSLSLDLSLVLARPSAFEYVLVHELCHLLHANHSRAFWREVEARFPRWRDERSYFRGEGQRLKAAMRALLAGGGR